MTSCRYEGCSKKHLGNGLCSTHYHRERKAKLRSLGLCPHHIDQQLAPGHERCATCLSQDITRREKQRGSGFCMSHPDRPIKQGTYRCDECAMVMSASSRKRRTGVTVQQYATAYKEQSGLCAICNQPSSGKALAADHDHATGEFRGLLCYSCNLGIGHFKDSPDLLTNAAGYLSKRRLKLVG